MHSLATVLSTDSRFVPVVLWLIEVSSIVTYWFKKFIQCLWSSSKQLTELSRCCFWTIVKNATSWSKTAFSRTNFHAKWNRQVPVISLQCQLSTVTCLGRPERSTSSLLVLPRLNSVNHLFWHVPYFFSSISHNKLQK